MVSLESGRMVSEHLDSERYHVVPAQISRQGLWYLAGELESDTHNMGTQEEAEALLPFQKRPLLEVGRSIDRILLGEEIDVAFIAMHGSYGEDGTIQGLLESFGVRYTGSGVCASALAMDKVRSRHMFMQHHLSVPRWMTFDRNQWAGKSQDCLEAIRSRLGLPCVVKPSNQGSSIGVHLVQDAASLEQAIVDTLSLARRVVIEEYVQGTEITCGVLEVSAQAKALPIVEIVSQRNFFDYEAKYDPRLNEEIVPARIGEAVADSASKAALKAHRALGCAGFSRTDMIVVGETPIVLETNTIPGLTPVSLFPKAAAAANIEFSRLLDIMVEGALSDQSY